MKNIKKNKEVELIKKKVIMINRIRKEMLDMIGVVEKKGVFGGNVYEFKIGKSTHFFGNII